MPGASILVIGRPITGGPGPGRGGPGDRQSLRYLEGLSLRLRRCLILPVGGDHKPHPMPVQVKICGINSAAAADAVVRAGADFGGLVFFAKSPRNLTLEAGCVPGGAHARAAQAGGTGGG